MRMGSASVPPRLERLLSELNAEIGLSSWKVHELCDQGSATVIIRFERSVSVRPQPYSKQSVNTASSRNQTFRKKPKCHVERDKQRAADFAKRRMPHKPENESQENYFAELFENTPEKRYTGRDLAIGTQGGGTLTQHTLRDDR